MVLHGDESPASRCKDELHFCLVDRGGGQVVGLIACYFQQLVLPKSYKAATDIIYGLPEKGESPEISYESPSSCMPPQARACCERTPVESIVSFFAWRVQPRPMALVGAFQLEVDELQVVIQRDITVQYVDIIPTYSVWPRRETHGNRDPLPASNAASPLLSQGIPIIVEGRLNVYSCSYYALAWFLLCSKQTKY